MKLKVRYPTSEREFVNEFSYHMVYETAELEPVKIFRFPCGRGAAANRYTYAADFVAPENSGFSHDGLIRENIVRKNNPHFKPKDFEWVGQKAVIEMATD